MPLCHSIFCSRGSGRLLTVAIPLTKTARFNCKTSCSVHISTLKTISKSHYTSQSQLRLESCLFNVPWTINIGGDLILTY